MALREAYRGSGLTVLGGISAPDVMPGQAFRAGLSTGQQRRQNELVMRETRQNMQIRSREEQRRQQAFEQQQAAAAAARARAAQAAAAMQERAAAAYNPELFAPGSQGPGRSVTPSAGGTQPATAAPFRPVVLPPGMGNAGLSFPTSVPVTGGAGTTTLPGGGGEDVLAPSAGVSFPTTLPTGGPGTFPADRDGYAKGLYIQAMSDMNAARDALRAARERGASESELASLEQRALAASAYFDRVYARVRTLPSEWPGPITPIPSGVDTSNVYSDYGPGGIDVDRTTNVEDLMRSRYLDDTMAAQYLSDRLQDTAQPYTPAPTGAASATEDVLAPSAGLAFPTTLPTGGPGTFPIPAGRSAGSAVAAAQAEYDAALEEFRNSQLNNNGFPSLEAAQAVNAAEERLRNAQIRAAEQVTDADIASAEATVKAAQAAAAENPTPQNSSAVGDAQRELDELLRTQEIQQAPAPGAEPTAEPAAEPTAEPAAEPAAGAVSMPRVDDIGPGQIAVFPTTERLRLSAEPPSRTYYGAAPELLADQRAMNVARERLRQDYEAAYAANDVVGMRAVEDAFYALQREQLMLDGMTAIYEIQTNNDFGLMEALLRQQTAGQFSDVQIVPNTDGTVEIYADGRMVGNWRTTEDFLAEMRGQYDQQYAAAQQADADLYADIYRQALEAQVEVATAGAKERAIKAAQAEFDAQGLTLESMTVDGNEIQVVYNPDLEPLSAFRAEILEDGTVTIVNVPVPEGA